MRTRITERRAFENERELLHFARYYLSEAFPNPERIGCPHGDALRLLAIQPLLSDQSIGEHMTLCSPCFRAYTAYLACANVQGVQRQRIHRVIWIRRFAAALGLATALFIAIDGFLPKRAKPIIEPRTSTTITAPEKSHQTETALYVPVAIDLGNASPVRGAEPAASAQQIIPSGFPLDLSLRLPLGSDERLYSITLRSKKHVVWTHSAQARRQSGETLLHVRADLSHIPAGEYDLQVASADRRLTVPVLIRKTLPNNRKAKP